MDLWSAFLAELALDRTFQLSALALVTFVLSRALARENRKRLRSATILFGIHLVLVPTAAAIALAKSSLHGEIRLVALIFATLGLIQMVATLLFSALSRVRVSVPRILQDVIVASTSIVAIFMLAGRAGLNLSGLIATSAVLTAVIGLAFQDTLGNVVGGLALQLDDSVRVGDWVKVGDLSGKVVEIRWRYTAIETRNWETVIVPNSLLVKGQVIVQGRRRGMPTYLRRWVYFNVDFRYQPSEVTRIVLEALRGTPIERVATDPRPDCVLMDLNESYGRYAVRYWLTDIAVDDPTDSVIRTRIYFALRRANIPLSMPAHAVFLTEDSSQRKQEKVRADMDRRLAALSHVELFHGLSNDERTHLAEHLRYAPFAPGEVMTRQGAEAHWLYMIVEGEVSIRIASDGAEREVARLQAGEFFGEMSLLTGERRTATVVALTPVECYRLDKAAFQELLVARPEVTETIADVLAKRKSELTAVREDLDADAEQMRVTRNDLVWKIRNFFSLDDAPPSDR
ncbi:MAG TPA: mechanosensitive ion channel family protein [Polyangiaceae bacterium]|nr:mechanosensitive ion channel family protein [Polyangiaceae bacterium]